MMRLVLNVHFKSFLKLNKNLTKCTRLLLFQLLVLTRRYLFRGMNCVCFFWDFLNFIFIVYFLGLVSNVHVLICFKLKCSSLCILYYFSAFNKHWIVFNYCSKYLAPVSQVWLLIKHQFIQIHFIYMNFRMLV